jgi:tRNA threonylcarbamoyladenosine biosynthesis protein TsaE
MPTVLTHTPQETEQLGETLGRNAPSGAVYGLSGDLGAGKTAFVRGFVRGVGSSRRVHSPTFALLHEYTGGRCPVFHLDLYRLETPEAIRGAGLDEYLDQPDGITLAEWIVRWESPEAPSGRVRHIRFRTVDEQTREITHDDPLP